MKRTALTAIMAVTVLCAGAQSLYVCNKDGSTFETLLKENVEITFDKEQKTIRFANIRNNYILEHYFATPKIDSISTSKPLNALPLVESDEVDVVFDAEDANNYTEVVETIITDELLDESGDFIENSAPEKRVNITFSETGVQITPTIVDGVTFTVKNNTHLTVDATPGKIQYIVKGECSDGSLKIYSTKKFQLMLGGLHLTNPKGPAINIQTGKTVYFTIGAGTTNSLCDGATYADAPVTNGEVEDQKGTLFSEGQVIFNGSGVLDVTSYGGHAICSDDYIRIRSGKINILSAAKDGFHTNDLFRVGRTSEYAPEISVNADGDAIDCGKGEIIIEAGKLLLNSKGEAIKVSNEDADTAVTASATIAGGYIKIATTGSKSSGIKTEGNYNQVGGTLQIEVAGDGSKVINCDGTVMLNGGKLTGISTGSMHVADTTSAGGIKCVGDINVKSGIISLKCTGDGAKAVNCDSDVIVEGGTVTLLSEGNDYYIADDNKNARAITCNLLTVNGGELVAVGRYERAVSADILLNAGLLHLISTDYEDMPVKVLPVQTGGWLMVKYPRTME